jgi:hypothetical protein
VNNPNQLLGAERALGINEAADRQNGAAAGSSCCGQSVSYGSTPDRTPTISATVEVPASYGFDAALRGIKQGHRVTRAGWNGRGQYAEMQRPDKHSRMTQPYAVLRNSNGDLVPWVPSQGDLFANDWALLP